MLIRPALPADLGGMVAMERSLATAPHWPETAYSPGSGRRVLVAEREGELLAFAVGVVTGDEAEVESIAVRQKEQRKGIGAALLSALLRSLFEAGARTVVLEVRAGSTGAQRLYRRAGFAEVGRRKAYYADPVEDAVVMRWNSPAT